MIKTKLKLENLEEIRIVKHTEIYRGVNNNKIYYLKVLKNYHSRVKKQDVIKSRDLLENIGLKCFKIVESGIYNNEKYYITEEVKGKDFEELLELGKTFEELKPLILKSMENFMTMLKNDLFYFGYNLKNFMVEDGELILIDIEEVQKKRLFKKKALTKTIWNSLRSLKAGSIRCNLSYEVLENMIFDSYDKIIGDSLKLKNEIKIYQNSRDRKKSKKNKG